MSPSHHVIHDSRGNRLSFEELYDRYFDAIFRYVLHRVGNVAEAEDLTSQTFFKALRSLWRFRWSGGSPSSWLYRIATNEINSYFRMHGPSRPVDRQVDPAELSRVDHEAVEAERVLSRNEILVELNGALRRLKPEEQTLLVLRYLEDKPFDEIAEILKKRPGAVTMRTHRALKKLKADLEKRGIDHERFREGFDEAAATRYPGGGVQAHTAP